MSTSTDNRPCSKTLHSNRFLARSSCVYDLRLSSTSSASLVRGVVWSVALEDIGVQTTGRFGEVHSDFRCHDVSIMLISCLLLEDGGMIVFGRAIFARLAFTTHQMLAAFLIRTKHLQAGDVVRCRVVRVLQSHITA